MTSSVCKPFAGKFSWHLAVAALIGLWSWPLDLAFARTITDSAGRQVEVPDSIARVHAAGPPASVLLYALAPQKMIGWLRAPRDLQKPFLMPAARMLPTIGRLTNRADLERLAGDKPDLIVDFGAVNDNYRSLANRVQAETGIPYLLIDGRLEATPDALRLLGGVLGVAERGETLARATTDTYAQVDRVLADVAADKRARVYFAGGEDGLQTGADGTNIAEIIERSGGINVAGGERQRGNVTAEQVVGWAPDTILTFNRKFRETVASRPAWQAVPAVAKGRIFVSPDVPFGFIHEPPSINRLIGVTWLLHALYPDKAPGNIREQVRAFYRLFYQVDVSESDVTQVLDRAAN